jgi:cysteine sulfinate desulfinase/cysteine desulfurase-like protein
MEYKSIVVDAKGKLEKAPADITGTKRIGICILGPEVISRVLQSTLLFSLICIDKKLCNVKLKEMLGRKKIIVGIGSACNIGNKKASHVLTAINAPAIVKRGVMRISFSCNNTKNDIDKFCDIMHTLFTKQMSAIVQ